MRILAPLALALSLTPAVAPAQDLAAEYMSAATVFSLPGAANDAAAHLLATEGLVSALPGRWAPAWIVLDDWQSPDAMASFDNLPEELAKWCGFLVLEARVTGPHSFDMAYLNRGEDTGHAVHHQYLLGRSFQRSVDELAFLERLGLADSDRPVPPTVYTGAGTAGVVEVFRPSANVLVFQPQGMTAEIYLRCP